MCSGELAQMVERPLSTHAFFSKDRENICYSWQHSFSLFLVLPLFLYFCFIFLRLNVTYAGRDSCPPAQNHSRPSWVHEIDHGVLPYYRPSAIS